MPVKFAVCIRPGLRQPVVVAGGPHIISCVKVLVVAIAVLVYSPDFVPTKSQNYDHFKHINTR